MTVCDGKVRCYGDSDPLMRVYHDEEWGVPVHDDHEHFELLVLEGAQAGLSWKTILNRREGYRRVFNGFNLHVVAEFTPAKVDLLLQDRGIIRNRRKVESAVKNARAFLKMQEEFGSFDRYFWGWVDGKPVVNDYTSWERVPAFTETSTALSKDLKRRGFTFVGPTTIYSHMQSAGLVNDHLTYCFRWHEIRDKYSKV
jgi:DNA-3-methyladenine glycosylase I